MTQRLPPASLHAERSRGGASCYDGAMSDMTASSAFTGLDCIVPAAGASSRMGAWKLLLPWRGVTVIEAVVAEVLSCCSRAIVVAGHRAEELEALFRGAERVLVVRNPDWEKGMFTSLKRGAEEVRTEAFFVALADMPLIARGTFLALDALRRAPVAQPGAQPGGAPPGAGPSAGPRAFRPVSLGRPGHPVLFESSALPIIAETGGSLSMKEVLARLDLVPWTADAGEGVFQDFDIPADYAASGPFAVLVTGSIGAGKTGALEQAGRLLRSRGLAVASCLQIASGRPEAGASAAAGRTGAQAYRLELEYGNDLESFPLARRLEAEGGEGGPDAAGGLVVAGGPAGFGGPVATGELALGPYRFSRAAFTRVADFLRVSAEAGARVLLLDEIGKLEMDRGEGLVGSLESAFEELGRIDGVQRALVLSVRRDRLEAFTDTLRARGIGAATLDLDRTRGDISCAASSVEAAVLVSLARSPTRGQTPS